MVMVYILVSGLLGVAGQIILKRGLASLGPLSLTPDTLLSTILSCALNPLIVLGLFVTVSGTFFWLVTLSRVDLSFAYPFASLNYVFVLAGSWLLLGETISPVRLAGVLAICAGVCLVARTSPRASAATTRATPTPLDTPPAATTPRTTASAITTITPSTARHSL
ncbi:MAG: EamA family transporter [Chloroflexota bacterium]